MLIWIKRHDFPMQVEDERTFDGRKAKNNEIDSQHASQDYFRPLGRLPACARSCRCWPANMRLNSMMPAKCAFSFFWFQRMTGLFGWLFGTKRIRNTEYAIQNGCPARARSIRIMMETAFYYGCQRGELTLPITCRSMSCF